ncbi:TPA: hypothetical protein IFA02_004542 [Escherichia coli]|nr:hypothetical protein [Escherichia coli]
MWGIFVFTYLSSSIKIPAIIDNGLSKLGEVSFSEYILHGVVLYSFHKKFGVPRFIDNDNVNAVINFLILLPAILIFSKICFELIEKPFLGFRKKYAK